MSDAFRSFLFWVGFALTFGGLVAAMGGILWDKLGRVLRFFEVDVGGRYAFRIVLVGFGSFLAGLAIVMNLPDRPATRPRPAPASLPPPSEPNTEE